MEAYVRAVLRARWLVLALVAAITLAALASMSRAVVASSVGKLFLGESPAYKQYLERAGEFGSDELLIVGFDAPSVLDAETRDRLRAAADGVAALPDVAHVESVLDVQHIVGDGESLRVASYEEEARSGVPAAGLHSELAHDPLVGGLLLSRDLASTAVVVELAPNATRSAERGPEIVAAILRIFADHGFDGGRTHLAGLLATTSEVTVQAYWSLRTIFPIVAVTLLLSVWLMFRRLWPAAVSLLVALLAATWTMGLAVAMDREVNILMSLVPGMVLIVSFSDVVHLCSAYLLELGSGKVKHDAILDSSRDVGRACFYTSLTTFVGFVSLSLVPTPVFRSLGLILGTGVAIALLLALTLTPVLFSLMRTPRPLRQGMTSTVHDAMDASLRACERVAVRHPWSIIGAFALLLVASVAGIARIHVETRFIERLSADNPMRGHIAWFQQRFSGTNVMDLYVTAAAPGGLLDAGLLAAIDDLEQELRRLPHVDSAVSLVDLMRILHREIEGPEASGRLPTTRAAVAQYLLLFEMAGGEELDRLVDFDRRTMRLLLRLDDGGFRTMHATGEAARRLAAERLGPTVTVVPSGLSYLLGGWLGQILIGQRNGVLLSMVLIAAMMAVAFRSLRWGLWSMVPNVLPLLALGGWVGLAWGDVDSDTLILATIAIGIGVDDTIHFLTRYRFEVEKDGDVHAALTRTFHFAGRAIIMTTIILVVGFAPFTTSDYFTTRILGTLLPGCLIVAVLADLLLVPAMVAGGFLPHGPTGVRDRPREKDGRET